MSIGRVPGIRELMQRTHHMAVVSPRGSDMLRNFKVLNLTCCLNVCGIVLEGSFRGSGLTIFEKSSFVPRLVSDTPCSRG